MNKYLIALKSPAAWAFAISGAIDISQQFRPCLPAAWVPYANSFVVVAGVVLSVVLHADQVHNALMTPPPAPPPT